LNFRAKPADAAPPLHECVHELCDQAAARNGRSARRRDIEEVARNAPHKFSTLSIDPP